MNTLPGSDRAAGAEGCNLPPEALALPADELLRSPEGVGHALIPVFICDAENLAVVAPNVAALCLSGHGAEEFLRLTILDIRRRKTTPASGVFSPMTGCPARTDIVFDLATALNDTLEPSPEFGGAS